MVFAWGENKDRVNRRKHGISFQTYRRHGRWPRDPIGRSHNRGHMAKKKSASSPQEKRIAASVLFTTPLTESQRRSLRKLAAKPDHEVDFSDAPQVKWPPKEIHVGRFYRPVKQLVSIRVDAEVLAWFRGHGKRYQTYMNEVLRREMQTRPRPATT